MQAGAKQLRALGLVLRDRDVRFAQSVSCPGREPHIGFRCVRSRDDDFGGGLTVRSPVHLSSTLRQNTFSDERMSWMRASSSSYPR